MVARTRTSVTMICRLTCTLSFCLFAPFSPSFSLTHSLSLVLSLFPSFILWVSFIHTHTDIIQPALNGVTERYVTKCGTHGISWFKTLFLLMFRKIYIYSNKHPLTRSQEYLTSFKCHINFFKHVPYILWVRETWLFGLISPRMHASPQTLCTFFTNSGSTSRLGRQRSGTVSCRDKSGVHHPLSPVMKLGIRHPRKKKNKRPLWA